MQQFLDSDPPQRPTVVVDFREDELFDRLISSMGARTERKMLDVGDFLCSAKLVVERKTRSDFEQSIIDGRLFSQLPNLVSNYERVVIIVEGTSDDGRLNRSSLLGTYATVLSDFGCSIIFTKDKESTAELVYHFAKHEQIAKKQPLRIYARKKTFTPSEMSRAIIESMPGIGPKLAKKILSHFGSVNAVINCPERDLAEVIGKKRAKIIKNTLNYEYIEDEDR